MKKLGFGCMRLPMKNEEVDYEEFKKMVDAFMKEGFTYFDTAHGYVSGKSEMAVRECLVKRYPRESYQLTDKLTSGFFKTEEELMPLFEKQLANAGVEYFDNYLLHALSMGNYQQYVDTHAFEFGLRLKAMGKIKHLGISFHDKADFLDKILTEHPEIEMVQIQFNYVDYDSSSIESYKAYQVCLKHDKPVIVMEPIKGGALVNLPDNAKKLFDDLQGGSYASYAIRYAASFDKVMMVLSGMSNMPQIEDNMSYMKDFQPLNAKELATIDKVKDIFKQLDIIPCTACRYCVDGCPKNIPIPDVFDCYNAKKQYNDWNSDFYYGASTQNKGKASDCIKCGKCEDICPQHLKIKEYLDDVKAIFEK